MFYSILISWCRKLKFRILLKLTFTWFALVADWPGACRTCWPCRMTRWPDARTGGRTPCRSCPRRNRTGPPRWRSFRVREDDDRTRSSSWRFGDVRCSIGRRRTEWISVRRKIRRRIGSRFSTASFGIGLGRLQTRLWIVETFVLLQINRKLLFMNLKHRD